MLAGLLLLVQLCRLLREAEALPIFSAPVATFAGNPVEKGALVRVNDRRRGTVTKIEGDLRLGAYECPGFLVQWLEVYHEVFCSSSLA